MYNVYTKHRSSKKAQRDGFYTDNLDRAIEVANRVKASWWGANGVYEWVRVRDMKTKKYVYET